MLIYDKQTKQKTPYFYENLKNFHRTIDCQRLSFSRALFIICPNKKAILNLFLYKHLIQLRCPYSRNDFYIIILLMNVHFIFLEAIKNKKENERLGKWFQFILMKKITTI